MISLQWRGRTPQRPPATTCFTLLRKQQTDAQTVSPIRGVKWQTGSTVNLPGAFCTQKKNPSVCACAQVSINLPVMWFSGWMCSCIKWWCLLWAVLQLNWLSVSWVYKEGNGKLCPHVSVFLLRHSAPSNTAKRKIYYRAHREGEFVVKKTKWQRLQVKILI